MKKMTRQLILGCAVMGLALSCSACDGGNATEEAENAVREMMTDLQNVNEDVIDKYFGIENVFGTDGNVTELGNFVTEAMSELEYNIIKSEKTDADTVAVTTEITAVDMKPLMQDLTTAMMEYAQSMVGSGEIPDEEETKNKVSELLDDALNAEGREKITNQVDIIVVKEGGEWTVSPDETVLNAVVGGVMDAVSSFTGM